MNSGSRRRARVAEFIDIAAPHDAVDIRPLAKQVFDALGHSVEAVDPRKDARVLQGKDRLIDGIPAAAGLFSDGLVGGKAKPVFVARKMPQERVQDPLVGGGDGPWCWPSCLFLAFHAMTYASIRTRALRSCGKPRARPKTFSRRGLKCFGKVLAIDMLPPFGLWTTRRREADFRQSNPVAKKGLHRIRFSGVSELRIQSIFPGFAGTPARLIGGFCVSRASFSPEKIAETSHGESAAAHRASLPRFLIRVESLHRHPLDIVKGLTYP
jgi:hypothetical protein